MNREQYDILLFVSRQGKVPYFDLLHSALSLKSCVARHRSMRVPSWSFFKIFSSDEISSVVDYKLKERRASTQIFDHAFSRQLYVFIVRIEASYLYSCYFRFFQRHPSRFVAVWNGYKFRMSIAVLVAKALGRQVVYFENGLLPNTTTMDFKGINAKNSLPRDPGFYLSLDYGTDVALPKKLEPRQAVRKSPQTPIAQQQIPTRYIFVPFQIDNDSQILINSPWIKNMSQLFGVIREIQTKLKDSDISFVFKEHPSCRRRYTELHELTRGERKLVFLNEENTQRLIESAKAVLTVNSTVGMEALLCGKKVIVVGDACYAIEGLVRTASSDTELAECIDTIGRWPTNEKLRTNFLKYVFTEYSVPDSYRAATERHWRAIETKLKNASAQAALSL